MATSKPITLQVSDLVQWYRNKELVINETFQRHSVWTTSAKTFLIDTILNELPLPKLFIRTKVDPITQKSVREVVDGQQRVRTLVEFANDELKLTSRSESYSGKKYTSLNSEEQEIFLSFIVTVEQLLNASDDDVIDIFARLNSYTVALNAAEKRHARYQTNFKYAIRKASQEFRGFIEKYNVFTVKKRFRMADDVFMADIFGVFLEGVKDGGESNINRLYDRQDDEVFTELIKDKIMIKIRKAFRFLDIELGSVLSGSLSKHYHLLMLIAAFAHHEYGIPKGDIDKMPDRGKLASAQIIRDRLADYDNALSLGEPSNKYKSFVQASNASTQRIASRKIRFLLMVKALSQ